MRKTSLTPSRKWQRTHSGHYSLSRVRPLRQDSAALVSGRIGAGEIVTGSAYSRWGRGRTRLCRNAVSVRVNSPFILAQPGLRGSTGRQSLGKARRDKTPGHCVTGFFLEAWRLCGLTPSRQPLVELASFASGQSQTIGFVFSGLTLPPYGEPHVKEPTNP